MNQIPLADDFVAECHGVRVPHSPFLHETRIARINAAAYEGQEIAGALTSCARATGCWNSAPALASSARWSPPAPGRADPLVRGQSAADPAYPPAAPDERARRGDRAAQRGAGARRRDPGHAAVPPHGSYLGSVTACGSARTAGTWSRWSPPPLGAVIADCGPQVMLVDIEGGERGILQGAPTFRRAGAGDGVPPRRLRARGDAGRCKSLLRRPGLPATTAIRPAPSGPATAPSESADVPRDSRPPTPAEGRSGASVAPSPACRSAPGRRGR